MTKTYTQPGSDFIRRIFPIKRLLKEPLLKRICCCLLILLPMVASAQKIITGTVKDNTGIPVIGATVTEKGAENSTTTDVDGKFKIILKNNADPLTISFVGFKAQTVVVGDLSKLSVVLLEDLNQMNEVVVVGYGTAKNQTLPVQ